jgi:ribosomal protein L11 methyltransferase
MTVLQLEVASQEADLIIAELYEAGATGITELPASDGHVRLDTYFEDDAAAQALARRFSQMKPTIVAADERDWVAHSRSLWSPVEVGDRFYLAPEWQTDVEVPEGRIFLPMPAGQGFGSGSHESTRLALSALEHSQVEGASVLDVGTGSGILLAAASALGATALYGCDTDPVAVEAAASYLADRKLKASLYLGSIDAVEPRKFHLVVANLNATLILNLLDQLFAALRPHGQLILSGILREEQDVIRKALEATPGITRLYHSSLGGWVNFRATTSVK